MDTGGKNQCVKAIKQLLKTENNNLVNSKYSLYFTD